jgi:hypothetical protein
MCTSSIHSWLREIRYRSNSRPNNQSYFDLDNVAVAALPEPSALTPMATCALFSYAALRRGLSRQISQCQGRWLPGDLLQRFEHGGWLKLQDRPKSEIAPDIKRLFVRRDWR